MSKPDRLSADVSLWERLQRRTFSRISIEVYNERNSLQNRCKQEMAKMEKPMLNT